VLAHRELVGELETTFLQGAECHRGRHQLGDRCGGQQLVGVGLVHDGAGVAVHQHRRLGARGESAALGERRKRRRHDGSQKQHQRQQEIVANAPAEGKEHCAFAPYGIALRVPTIE
jgi:hypothetical protein